MREEVKIVVYRRHVKWKKAKEIAANRNRWEEIWRTDLATTN